MDPKSSQTVNAIEWREDRLRILDQTYLPGREVYTNLQDIGHVWDAIKKLRIRGAPAIGIAGAYGLYLGARDIPENSFESFYLELERLSDYLLTSRPTAINLYWALNRIKTTVEAHKKKEISQIKEIILTTAKTIHDEDRRLCKAIGEQGVGIVPENARILTHCNTGSLATGQYGTAFSVILHSHKQEKLHHVWVGETRPLLQGGRLTTWELQNENIPFKLITDSTAGFLMQRKEVDLVIVGADRITANGDTANKIGTYSLAVLAKEHDIPFYVAAPCSTVDLSLKNGSEIPIEERDPEEITHIASTRLTPKKIEVFNPAFDITPHKYIKGIITEKGVISPDYSTNLKSFGEDN
ncbi:MAG: S-methyl-5-thioribose-1-phosphate isomerase [Balneolaceae bacterium]